MSAIAPSLARSENRGVLHIYPCPHSGPSEILSFTLARAQTHKTPDVSTNEMVLFVFGTSPCNPAGTARTIPSTRIARPGQPGLGAFSNNHDPYPKLPHGSALGEHTSHGTGLFVNEYWWPLEMFERPDPVMREHSDADKVLYEFKGNNLIDLHLLD